MCKNWRGCLREWLFHRIFSSRLPRPIMRPIIGRLFPISTRWNIHEITSPTTSNGTFYFPISIFDVPFFFSLALLPGFFTLSLSLFLVAPSTIETTVSKEKEINRDNIYLSPQKKERKKERNEKHRPSILTSFFLIVIFPCGIWRKISTKKKKEKMNKKEDRKDKGGKVSGNVLRGVWRGNF